MKSNFLKISIIYLFLFGGGAVFGQGPGHQSKLSANRGGISTQTVLDSINAAKFHTHVSDISEIAALSLPNGWEITVVPSGERYVTQATAVTYYTTDGINVIAIASGNYAVIDLTEKRSFQSKEELKKLVHFCNFKDGETIKIGQSDFEIKFHAKTFHRDLGTSSVQDKLVDGFFTDTLQVSVPNKNLVFYSETFNNNTFAFPDGSYGPYIFLNGNAGKVSQNMTDAPDGSMTAERLFAFNSTASNQIQIYGNKLPVQIGDTITFSFYARGLHTTGSSERIASASSFGGSYANINFTLDGKWRRYQATTVAASIPGTNSIYFGLPTGFANGDTLDVWGFMINKGSTAPDYHQSTWDRSTNTDKMYLYRKGLLRGKTLDLSEIRKNEYTVTGANKNNDAIFIQAAIDYCKEGERCNEVLLPLDEFYCTAPITMKRGVVLSGANPAARTYSAAAPSANTQTVIKFALTDKTKYAITILPYGSLTVVDNTGLKNLVLSAVDTLAGFVKTKEISNCTFSYITGNVITSGYFGAIDSCAWDMQVAGSSDNHYNNFFNVYVGAPSAPFGLKYGGGVSNNFLHCAFIGNVCVRVNGGVFNATRLSVETGNTGILVNSGSAYVYNFYSEGSAYNGGSTLKMTGGQLYVYNSSLRTSTVNDTLLNLVSGSSFALVNSKIEVQGKMKIASTFDGGVEFKNVGTVTELRPFLNLSLKQTSFVDITGNYDLLGTNPSVFSSTKGAVKQAQMLIKNSNLENSTLADTLKTSGVILKGGEENLTNKSSEIPTYTSTNHKVIQDVVADQNGNMTADMVIMTATTASEFMQDKVVIEAYEIGEPYTISMWLKGISSANPATYVTARLGTGGQSVNFFINSAGWKRYEKTIYANVSNTNFNLRVTSLVSLDTFAIAGVQVNKGYHATSLINTTTTGILEGGNPEINILELDSLEINGVTKISTDLIVSGDAFHNHSRAELYNDKTGAIIQTVVANTPEQLLSLTQGLMNDFTESGDTLYYNSNHTKIFNLNCSAQWSSDQAASINKMYVYLNDVEVVKFYAEHAITLADDIYSAGMSGLIQLSTGDEITIYIESDSSGDMEIKHINFSLSEL